MIFSLDLGFNLASVTLQHFDQFCFPDDDASYYALNISCLDFGRTRLSSTTSPKKSTERFMPAGGSFVQVGKRFVKSSQSDDVDAKDVAYERHERSKAYFAKAHQRRMTRQEEIEKERKGRRQAQVSFFGLFGPPWRISWFQIVIAFAVKPGSHCL